MSNDSSTLSEKLVILYRQTNDPRHFEELYRRFQPEITSFTLRLLSGQFDVDAEAVASEVFAAFHTYCQSTRPVRPVRAWLHSAARLRAKEAVRTRRRKKRGGNSQRQDLRPDILRDPGDTPDAHAERQELIGLLRLAMGMLTPFDQGIVNLFYVDALSTSQIAMQLGVAQKTVKRHLAAIREKLRQHILAFA